MKEKEEKKVKKPMKRSVFWINIAAMLVVVVLAVLLTLRWTGSYTQHGKAIQVPDVTGIDEAEAIAALQAKKLRGISNDKSYVKDVPAGVVVAQRPEADAKVKRGRMVYLTLSSGNEPMIALPDIADNSSLRQASSQLRAAGFSLTPHDTIRGEADWVYKVLYNGREMHGGDLVPEGAAITLVIGNGEKEKEKKPEPVVDDDWF
ncbi:MAG: PASTA domain-containing protein [Bacteroidales bacterium]|nr:PASTA domain-containing protein [Bacteroidales bacterium]